MVRATARVRLLTSNLLLMFLVWVFTVFKEMQGVIITLVHRNPGGRYFVLVDPIDCTVSFVGVDHRLDCFFIGHDLQGLVGLLQFEAVGDDLFEII